MSVFARPFSVSLLAFVCFAGAGLIAGEAPVARIRLLNGDTFDAAVSGYENDTLAFQPRWSRSPGAVGFRFLDWVALPPGEGTEAAAEPSPVLWLTHGDRIGGKLTSVSGEWLEWETTRGENLRARRTMVDRVEFAPPRDQLLSWGVVPLSIWDHQDQRAGAPDPAAISGALYFSPASSMGVARKLPRLPERFSIEFSLETPSNSFNYNLFFFGETLSQRAPGSLVVNVNQQQVFLQNVDENGRMTMLGRTSMSEDTNKEQTVLLFTDTGTRKTWVYLNGSRIQEWDLPAKVRPGVQDLWVGARIQSTLEPLRLSGYRVLTWNGEFPGAGAPPRRPVLDTFLSWDGEFTHARLSGVRGESLLLERALGGETHLTMPRTRSFLPAVNGRATPRRQSRDVEIRFHDSGDRLTLALKSIDGQALHGTSEAWEGVVRVPLAAVSSIRFQSHRLQSAALAPAHPETREGAGL